MGGPSGENIGFGIQNGAEFVTALFVDDGVKNKGHREAIVNRNYDKVGLAYCEHKSELKAMLIIVYAAGFEMKVKGTAVPSIPVT